MKKASVPNRGNSPLIQTQTSAAILRAKQPWVPDLEGALLSPNGPTPAPQPQGSAAGAAVLRWGAGAGPALRPARGAQESYLGSLPRASAGRGAHPPPPAGLQATDRAPASALGPVPGRLRPHAARLAGLALPSPARRPASGSTPGPARPPSGARRSARAAGARAGSPESRPQTPEVDADPRPPAHSAELGHSGWRAPLPGRSDAAHARRRCTHRLRSTSPRAPPPLHASARRPFHRPRPWHPRFLRPAG